MTAVETRDIRYSYPARGKAKGGMALKGITLNVQKGEIFGFLGPNGSGKTTLFRILSTLVRPTDGDAFIFGHDLKKNYDAARRALGVVFQHPSLDKKLTVEENLVHHGHIYGIRGEELRRRVEQQMERFGLTARREEFVETLSGGFRRRVELAKSLIHSPELLILDEPSTGLDPVARRELWDTITMLRNKQGLTVLVTTHLGEEGDRCNRLAILNEGNIIASGTPDELKSEIGGDVITISAAAPEDFAARIRQKFNVHPQVVEGAVRIELARGHEFIPQVVEAFPGLVQAVTLGKPTLEDVFIHRTGKKLWAEAQAESAA
ncbi:MAG: ATP-binding cassette domain-containing protein [Nitrospinae bacterium]|nr:ATP-binding cassette domain-containing protein [Nitrospinota bacterium]